MPPKKRNIKKPTYTGQTLSAQIETYAGLTRCARKLLILLKNKSCYFERLWMSNETLSVESGYSVRMLQYAFAELEEANFIRRDETNINPRDTMRWIHVFIKKICRFFKPRKREKRKKSSKIDKYPPFVRGVQSLHSSPPREEEKSAQADFSVPLPPVVVENTDQIRADFARGLAEGLGIH